MLGEWAAVQQVVDALGASSARHAPQDRACSARQSMRLELTAAAISVLWSMRLERTAAAMSCGPCVWS